MWFFQAIVLCLRSDSAGFCTLPAVNNLQRMQIGCSFFPSFACIVADLQYMMATQQRVELFVSKFNTFNWMACSLLEIGLNFMHKMPFCLSFSRCDFFCFILMADFSLPFDHFVQMQFYSVLISLYFYGLFSFNSCSNIVIVLCAAFSKIDLNAKKLCLFSKNCFRMFANQSDHKVMYANRDDQKCTFTFDISIGFGRQQQFTSKNHKFSGNENFRRWRIHS